MKEKFLLFIFILLIFGNGLSQEELVPVSGVSRVDLGCSFQLWKIGYEEAITQISFPLHLMIFLNENTSLSITHNPAFSAQADQYKITSTSDTWIQGNHIFWKNKALLNIGLGLPTGKTRLNHTDTENEQMIESEFQLSQYLSKNLFRFRLPVYGQGFCGKIGGGIALPLEDLLVFGVGLQYIYTGSYHPMVYRYTFNNQEFIEDNEYNPGDEVSFNMGLDFKINKSMKIMVDGLYTYYWQDYKDGKEVFGAGNKVVMDVGYYCQFDHRYIWAHALYRHKGKYSLWDGASFGNTNQDLRGSQVEVEAQIKAFDFENGGVVFLTESRYYQEIERKDDSALIYGGGFQTDVKFPDNIVAGFTMKYMLGYLKEGDLKRDLRGTEIVFWVRFEF